MADLALCTTATVMDALAGSGSAGRQCVTMGYETPGTIRSAPNVTTGAILLLAGR